MWYYFAMSKKGLKNKHKDLVGKRFRKTDFAQWDELKFMNWFSLVHFFTVEGKFSVTDVSIRAFQSRAKENPRWEEWMWRYEAAGDDYATRSFMNRLISTTATIGQYLQENPHAITHEMKGVMEANEMLRKYTEPFAVKETESGAEIVSTNMDGGRYALPEVQYHKALLKMAAMANDLMTGITKDDIKKMSPGERIKLANALTTTMSKLQGGHRPNIQVFKQLVLNQAGREDLEAAMVEMAGKT